MDPFSTVIILLVAFLAWNSGVQWLFWGLMILFLVTVRNLAIVFVTLLGLGVLWLFRLNELFGLPAWFIVFMIVVVLVLLTKKEEPAAGGEMYSPELMQLLGGGGGEYGGGH